MKVNDSSDIFLFIPIPKALVATIIGISLFKIVVEQFDVLDNSNHHDKCLLRIPPHKLI